jgi:hypothetical protein
MVQYTGVSVTEDNPLIRGKHQHHRAVLKNGACNLYPSHVAQHKWRFIQDSVTTLVDMRWRYILSLCTFTFFFSWTAFAVLWWLIAYAHGDFEEASQASLYTSDGVITEQGWQNYCFWLTLLNTSGHYTCPFDFN